MPIEFWKSIFETGGVVLLGLTFLFGLGALYTNIRINSVQEQRLRKFDKDLTDEKNALSIQQERAANADARVVGLEIAASDAKTEMAKQQARAATAERSLLELQERIKPRRLTDQESAKFVAALRVLPNGSVQFGYTSAGGDEALNFAKQLMALFKEARWTIENEAKITNHLEVQVIGLGILTRGLPTPNSETPPPPSFIALTPTTATLRSAFRSVEIEPQFINYHPAPGDTPEVVVGSKPQP